MYTIHEVRPSACRSKQLLYESDHSSCSISELSLSYSSSLFYGSIGFEGVSDAESPSGVVEPYRYPPVSVIHHLCTRHPSSLFFSYAFLGRFGWLTVTEVLLLAVAVAVVLFREKVAASPLSEAMLDVSVGSGRLKIMGIASGLSFFRQDIPIVGAIADAGWKQSSLKCLSHKKLCLDHRYYTLRRTHDLWNGPSKHRYYTLRYPCLDGPFQ